jgi:hypothetical protein
MLATRGLFGYLYIAMNAVQVASLVARNMIFRMTTGELHTIDFDCTPSTFFAACRLLAEMVANFVATLTWLFTAKDLMHSS